MDVYRPSQPSGLQKFIFNPFLHVSIVFLLLAATVLFIRERRREELKARIEYLNAGPIVVERSESSATTTQSMESNEASTEAANANSAGGELAVPTNSASANGNTSGTPVAHNSAVTLDATQPAARNLGAKPALMRVLIVYAEVDRQTVNTWLAEMRAQSSFKSFDQVSTGVITNIGQKLRSSGVKILQQVEQPIKSASSNHEWFVGTHRSQDMDNEMGFFSSLVVTDQRDGLARGDIEVQRAFRDPSDPQKTMDRISYGGNFEMPVGSGFVMRGLLPSRYAMDIDEDLNPDSFLSILKSRKFLSEESEFIFILDFDSSPSANK